MANDAVVTVVGYVATEPSVQTVNGGTQLLRMRVGWTPRVRDWQTGEWRDKSTSYATVVCWRTLANNVASCLRKGHPVVIKGHLTVQEYADREGRPRARAEIEALSIGHDLSRGVGHFSRTRPDPAGRSASEIDRELARGEAIRAALIPEGGTPGPAAESAASAGGHGPAEGGGAVAEEDEDILDEEAVEALVEAGSAEQAAPPF